MRCRESSWSSGSRSLASYFQGAGLVLCVSVKRAMNREALESIQDYLRERQVSAPQLRRSTGSLDKHPNEPIVNTGGVKNDHAVAIWRAVDSWILGLRNAHRDQRRGWVGRRGHSASVGLAASPTSAVVASGGCDSLILVLADARPPSLDVTRMEFRL